MAHRSPAALVAACLALALSLTAGCASAGAALVRPGPGPSAQVRATLDALVSGPRADAAAVRAEAAAASAPGDPWARLAAALAARRALDGAAEVRHLAALVAAVPAHPLALVALRRLGELPEGSPGLARAVEAAVAPLVASGRLAGLAAFRARVARVAAAEAQGDLDAVARQRAGNGALTAWTLAGPFGALHAFDLLRRLPPEEGTLPSEAPAPLLGAPRPTRPLPALDGIVSLEPEPADGDVWYLASDVTLARGGRYLVVVGATGSVRLWVDGVPALERRAFEGNAPGQLVRPLELAAGHHVVLAKVARGGGRGGLIVSLARADGAPSDAASLPRPPGPQPVAAAGPWPASVLSPVTLAEALAPGGPALSRWLAARDAMTGDLEAAKGLIDDGLRAQPGAAALLAARGAAASLDPTLDDQVAKGRAEGALRAALAADPGDGDTRLGLADLLRRADRPLDAEAVLAALPEALARQPAALALRARVALDRSLPEEAEALAESARVIGGSCDALRLLADQAARRDARAREEELAKEELGCAGGRDRLARLLEQRGDSAGVLTLMGPVARVRPAQVSTALRRAAARVAEGDPAAAARELEPALDAWPRHPPLLKAAADDLELAGDRAGARRLRERALLVDGADLTLRRALALEDGGDVLSDAALDGLAAVRDYLATPHHEEAGSALVLDAAAVELHPGGALTSRVHQVIRVLEQRAVDQYGELTAPPGAQVVQMRTVKPDGRILEPDGGDGKGANSLTGLEPGDFVDFEFLQPARGPFARLGVAADAFYFATPGASMTRSTYLVRAPPGLGLTVDAHGMEPPPVRPEGPFEVARVERTDVPALVPEPGAPPGPELVPFVQVGSGGGREAVQLALADAVVERSASTRELRALAAEVRASAGKAPSPEALARAAYARVRELVVGPGGGLAEDASVVLSRGRGSRLVLLKALLDLLGVPARFAAARPFGADATPYRFPTPGLWPYPLLRLALPGGVRWLDPSSRQQPFGELSERALGAEALVLPAPGEAPTMDRTPSETGRREGRELDVRVALAADGSAEVEGIDRYHGALGAASKAAFESLDERARRQAVEQLLSRSLRAFDLTTLSIEGEDDPEAPLAVRWKGQAAALAREADGALVVDAPLTQARLGARFVQLARRTTPLLLEATERAVLRLTVVPPPGYSVQVGPAAERTGPFGSLVRSERIVDGALVREDRLELKRGRVAPADYPAFVAFAGAVDEIQALPVTLVRVAGPVPATTPSTPTPRVSSDLPAPTGK